jgi:hypothetical protein
LIVDDDHLVILVAIRSDVPAGKIILVPISVQYIADGPAVAGMILTFRLQATVDPELPGLRFTTGMTGLNDDRVTAMLGVRDMPVGGDDAANTPMVEREVAEVLGDQDDRVSPILVRTEFRDGIMRLSRMPRGRQKLNSRGTKLR